jgi:hypothetical protein
VRTAAVVSGPKPPSTTSFGAAPAVLSFCWSSFTAGPLNSPPAPTTGCSEVPATCCPRGSAVPLGVCCSIGVALAPSSATKPPATAASSCVHMAASTIPVGNRCMTSTSKAMTGVSMSLPKMPLTTSRGVAPTALSFCCAKPTSALSEPRVSTVRTGGGSAANAVSSLVEVAASRTPLAGAMPEVVWNVRTAASVSGPKCPSSTIGFAEACVRLSLRWACLTRSPCDPRRRATGPGARWTVAMPRTARLPACRCIASTASGPRGAAATGSASVRGCRLAGSPVRCSSNRRTGSVWPPTLHQSLARYAPFRAASVALPCSPWPWLAGDGGPDGTGADRVVPAARRYSPRAADPPPAGRRQARRPITRPRR